MQGARENSVVASPNSVSTKPGASTQPGTSTEPKVGGASPGISNALATGAPPTNGASPVTVALESLHVASC